MGLGSSDSTDKSDTAAFGPNLRRIRLQRGVSLERIAADTKVGITLWAGLERNDLSRWPTGIYARAYVRAYAQAIGIDPEAAVDEFCRTFPHGDRRAEPTMRGHAEIVGHDDLDWRDELSGDDVERRADGVNAQSTPAIAPRANPLAAVVGRLRRVLLGRI
ncbi:MAG TPA: helix-turn-helix transcriptional regulator [Vicinamibacterales bacterium]|nr:helix-turn-helix transcriptional regulator [Vicinamibacterales bacterium]